MEHFLNLNKSRSMIGDAGIGSVSDFYDLALYYSTQSPIYGKRLVLGTVFWGLGRMYPLKL